MGHIKVFGVTVECQGEWLLQMARVRGYLSALVWVRGRRGA